MECKKCSKGFRNKSFVSCDGVCGGNFHIGPECADISEYDLNLWASKKNILYMCDECIDSMKSVANKIERVLEVLNESKNSMSKQESEMKKLLEMVTKMNDNKNEIVREIKKVCVNDKNESYASKLKLAAVIVKPKQKQNQTKSKDDLKRSVNPAGFKIDNVTVSQSGTVAIKCVDVSDRDRMKNLIEEKMGDQYDVKVLTLRNPKVCVSGMDTKYSEDDIIKRLKEQNDFIAEYDIKCMKVIEKKNIRDKSAYYSAIIEINAEGFDKLMKKERVSIGWNRCRVYDCLNVKRCYKCLGFNHKSTECKLSDVCARCLGNHKRNEKCREHEAGNDQCVNCIRANKKLSLNMDIKHNSLSRECPVYVRMLQIEKQRVNY